MVKERLKGDGAADAMKQRAFAPGQFEPRLGRLACASQTGEERSRSDRATAHFQREPRRRYSTAIRTSSITKEVSEPLSSTAVK